MRERRKVFAILNFDGEKNQLKLLNHVSYKTKLYVIEKYKNEEIKRYLYNKTIFDKDLVKNLLEYYIIFISEEQILDLIAYFASKELFKIEFLKKDNNYYNFVLKVKLDRVIKFKFKILERYLEPDFLASIVDVKKYGNKTLVAGYAGVILLICYLKKKIPLFFHELLASNSISSLIYNSYLNHFKPEVYFDANQEFHQWFNDDFKFLSKWEDTLIRPSYFGGRTDVFIHAKKHLEMTNVYIYDCNNFYPYLMKKELPVSRMVFFSVKDLTVDLLEEKKKTWYGFAKIRFKCPENILIPILLMRTSVINETAKNFAPIGGYYIGVYYSEEIKKAVEIGYEVEFLEFYEFRRKKIFDKILNIFERKDLQDNLEKKFYKLCINRLYGYFGINYFDDCGPLRNHLSIDINNVKNDFNNTIYQEIGGEYFKQNKKNSLNKGNVAIASAITAEGRLHLYAMIEEYKKEIVYVDTDSLFLLKKLPEKVLGLAPGEFKMVYPKQVVKDIIVISSKFYAIKFMSGEELLVIKGYNHKNLEWNYDILKQKLVDALINNKEYISLSMKDSGLIINLKLDIIKRRVYDDDIFIRTLPRIV